MKLGKVRELMRELDLEIDDIRWYLAAQQAERLLQYRGKLAELSRLIWSGALEQELYNMEERFVEQLQRDLDQGLKDGWACGKSWARPLPPGPPGTLRSRNGIKASP